MSNNEAESDVVTLSVGDIDAIVLAVRSDDVGPLRERRAKLRASRASLLSKLREDVKHGPPFQLTEYLIEETRASERELSDIVRNTQDSLHAERVVELTEASNGVAVRAADATESSVVAAERAAAATEASVEVAERAADLVRRGTESAERMVRISETSNTIAGRAEATAKQLRTWTIVLAVATIVLAVATVVLAVATIELVKAEGEGGAESIGAFAPEPFSR